MRDLVSFVLSVVWSPIQNVSAGRSLITIMEITDNNNGEAVQEWGIFGHHPDGRQDKGGAND